MEAVFTFRSAHLAMKGERLLLSASVAVKVMPLPSALGAGCGLCLRVAEEELPRARAILAESGVEAEGVYWKSQGGGQSAYSPA